MNQKNRSGKILPAFSFEMANLTPRFRRCHSVLTIIVVCLLLNNCHSFTTLRHLSLINTRNVRQPTLSFSSSIVVDFKKNKRRSELMVKATSEDSANTVTSGSYFSSSLPPVFLGLSTGAAIGEECWFWVCFGRRTRSSAF